MVCTLRTRVTQAERKPRNRPRKHVYLSHRCSMTCIIFADHAWFHSCEFLLRYEALYVHRGGLHSGPCMHAGEDAGQLRVIVLCMAIVDRWISPHHRLVTKAMPTPCFFACASLVRVRPAGMPLAESTECVGSSSLYRDGRIRPVRSGDRRTAVVRRPVRYIRRSTPNQTPSSLVPATRTPSDRLKTDPVADQIDK